MIALLALHFTASAAPITVNNEAQLRNAMSSVYSGDTIVFGPAVTTITLTAAQGPLPVIDDDDVTIDGGGDVVIDGSAITGDGFVVDGATGVTIQALEIVGFSGVGVLLDGADDAVVGGDGVGNVIRGNGEAGVRITSSDDVVVEQNRVGITAGDVADGNCGSSSACGGIEVDRTSDRATLEANLVAGNEVDGVRVSGDDAVLRSNLIGTTSGLSVARPNGGHGVMVFGGMVGIGQIDPCERLDMELNVIVANDGDGVRLGQHTSDASLSGNFVGVGAVALGNGGDGIHLSSTSYGHTIDGLASPFVPTHIGSNGGSGVVIDGEGHTVDNTFVGLTTTDADLGNALYGIRVVGHTAPDDVAVPHRIGTVEGNRVSSNGLGGIWVDAPNTFVHDNVIGLDYATTTAAGNGQNPQSLPGSFGGVLVTAPVEADAVPPEVTGNVVAGNAGHGIWVLGGQHADGTDNVYLDDNTVGVGVGGTPVADGGDGIRIEGATGATVSDSTIASAAGAGVHVVSTLTRPADDVLIADNDIGDVAGGAFGPGGHGVWLQRASGGLQVHYGEVRDNVIRGSGDQGIALTGGANYTLVTHNLISDSGTCAYRNDAPSNDGNNVWFAPHITAFDSTSVEGTVDMPGSSVARIEVYEGSDLEAGTHIGDVTVIDPDGSWELTGVTVAATSIDEIRALAVKADGAGQTGLTTSDLTRVPLDGCEPLDCLANNTDADWCTFEANYDDETCQTVIRDDGYTCSNKEPRDDQVTLGDLSGRDTCQSGVCTGPLTTDLDRSECTYATNCNIAYFDDAAGWAEAGLTPAPGQEYERICRYRAKCGDTVCGVDDLSTGTGDPCTQTCAEAACTSLQDGDGDGYPNTWEEGYDLGLNQGFDWDCDGVADDVFGDADDSEKQTFLVLAYMSTDCSDTSETYQLTEPQVHSHRPTDADLDVMVQAFAGGGTSTLVIDLECVPHYTQVSMAHHRPNLDPDCDGLFDFIYFRQLKAYAFEPWQRGIYRFGLVAHGLLDPDLSTSQHYDGKCTSVYEKSGDAEFNGDDFRVFRQKGVDFDTGNVADLDNEPNHSKEFETIFHEYGHTLNLGHGGAGSVNKKPHYQSRMNYRYQGNLEEEVGAWTDPGGKGGVILFDYSREDEGDFNENQLSEGAGFVSGMPNGERRWMRWTCPSPGMPHEYPYLPDGHLDTGLATPQSWVDWDCDGQLDPTNVAVDLNGDGQLDAQLKGSNDWARYENAAFCSLGNYIDDSREPEERRTDTLSRAWLEVAPQCAANAVSLDDHIPLRAVLHGSADHDVSTVERSTLFFAGGQPRRMEVGDVDADGYDDLNLWFRPSDLHLMHSGSARALFNARTSDHELWWDLAPIDPDTWPDSDNDRVVDACDQCPGSNPGTAVNAVGCP